VADPKGFLAVRERELPTRRPVPVRIQDWREVYEDTDRTVLRRQAGRCMDCGIPFCHHGCPLGNLIPEWNDLTWRDDWHEAIERLHATNNFPEFTGRLCPAPCESACVLGINQPAVTIKQVEVSIVDTAFDNGWGTPKPPDRLTGKTVAVVGSGPAGLAGAQQLARAGHKVTVYERDDRIGGLLRYGIPDFKLEKRHIDRRLDQLVAEGVEFVTGVNVGVDLTVAELRARHDAVLLAAGALAGRDVPATPGRHLPGVDLAMTHLVGSNRFLAGLPANPRDPAVGPLTAPPIDAAGKHVVIIGGGDTAADCLGVSHRQGAASVTQLDIYPRPPDSRDAERDPWPLWPWILRTYPAHEEGGDRVFAVAVNEFVGHDRLEAVRISEVNVTKVDGRRIVEELPGTTRDLPADIVLLAIGFDGTEEGPLLDDLELVRNRRGGIACGPDWQTDAPGVFVAGDMHRGASLIVWAIAEGRSAAAAIHSYLGGAGSLPAPVLPSSAPLAVR